MTDAKLLLSNPRPGRTLRVLAWNIWNGGREDGIDEGVERVVECIRDSGADIVAMQETYGSGPRIADALGYHLYLRSSNLSIISRYPAIGHHDLFRPFNLAVRRWRRRRTHPQALQPVAPLST